MEIKINIPKNFTRDYIADKFKDFFSRVIADIDNNGLCGNCEKEIAEMFINAFDESIEANNTCNCQHNSNPRDDEPCCRCDSRKLNINKAKVDSLEVIAQMLGNKPYYELKYRLVGKKDYSIGYSSYDLKVVLSYIDEYFEIVKSDKQTNADRIRNMSDEQLAEFLVGFKNTFGEEYEGEASCMEWLQSEAE